MAYVMTSPADGAAATVGVPINVTLTSDSSNGAALETTMFVEVGSVADATFAPSAVQTFNDPSGGPPTSATWAVTPISAGRLDITVRETDGDEPDFMFFLQVSAAASSSGPKRLEMGLDDPAATMRL